MGARGGMGNMLLLNIATISPEHSLEALKRWEETECMKCPNGVRLVNQWIDAGGSRVFTLYDVESIEAYMSYNFPFTDLCKVEVFPVIEAEALKKLAAEQMKILSKLISS